MVLRSEEGLGEDVGSYLFSWGIFRLDLLLLIGFSDEMMSSVDMFGPGMMNGIPDQFLRALVVVLEIDGGHFQSEFC
jgi:hypothetical protein